MMRTSGIVLGVALFALPGLAAAQAWKDYSYPDQGFGVAFPAPPTVTISTYHTLQGVSVPAQVYATSLDGVDYSVTVADFSKAQAAGQAAMEDAIKQLGQTGEVKADTNERISRNYGHDIMLAGKDGSRSAAAVFFVNDRLYELVGKAKDPDSGSAKTARFQQTLVFTNR